MKRQRQEAIRTPNLDRLAAQSLDFRRAYTASPLCLPSRATLATGLWPHNHGAVRNPAYAETLAYLRGATIDHLIEHSLPNRST